MSKGHRGQRRRARRAGTQREDDRARAIRQALHRLPGIHATGEPPPRIVLTLRDRVMQAWADRGSRACEHLRRSDQPAHLLAWAPDMLRCVGCVHALEESVIGTDEDHTCDYCRRMADHLLPAVGPLWGAILVSAACGGCLAEITAAGWAVR